MTRHNAAIALASGFPFACGLTLFLVPSVFSVVFFGLAVTIAIILIRWHDATFLLFILSLWLTAPIARRLSDWGAAALLDGELLLLVPYLGTAMVCSHFLARKSAAIRKALFPFFLSGAALLPAFFYGVIANGFSAASYGLITWLVPICLGLYLASRPTAFDLHQETLTTFFLWGGAVLGGYGVAQYFLLPSWDALWIRSAGMGSVGAAEPMAFHVFSTMNSPGVFAIFAMVAVVYLAAIPRVRAFGLASFFLSLVALGLAQVRSAWGGALLGAIAVFVALGPRLPLKILVYLGAGLVFFGVAASQFPALESVPERASTLLELEDDRSYAERVEFHNAVAGEIAANPLGFGMGALGGAGSGAESEAVRRYGGFDSGILELPFVLGWPGAMLYTLGVATLIYNGVQNSLRRRAPDSIIYLIIALSMLSQLVFGPAHRAPPGLFLWVALGMLSAGRARSTKHLAL